METSSFVATSGAHEKRKTIQVVVPDEKANRKRKRIPVVPDEEGEEDVSDSFEVDNKFNKDNEGEESIMSRASDELVNNTDPTGPLVTVSSSTVPKQFQEDEDDEAILKYRSFKSFDTVEDFSDHYYESCSVTQSKQTSQKWAKAIQQDWRLLENDLPDTIFARAYEGRMDLLRAVIVGAAGTPYHDGLFFFDIHYPSEYPNTPPLVNYHAHNLRINPNLSKNGNICLSLLNTYIGSIEEHWTPGLSTMLQVLLSLQALVLNEKPFFNEAVNERWGEKASRDYNESTFILSCRTMLYTLKNPPKYFEDYVVGHFRLRAYTILAACKAYIEGAQVGSVVEQVQEESQKIGSSEKEVGKCVEGLQDVNGGQNSGSSLHLNGLHFKSEVGSMVGSLVPVFISKGAKNCEQFICLGDQAGADESQAHFQPFAYSPPYYSSDEYSPPYSPVQAQLQPLAHCPAQAQSQPLAHWPAQAPFRPLTHPRPQFQPFAPKPAQNQSQHFAHSQAQFRPLAHYPDQAQPLAHPQVQFQSYAHYPAQAQFRPLAHPQAQFQPLAHPQVQFQTFAHYPAQAQCQPSAHPQGQFQTFAHYPAQAHFQPWAHPQSAHSQAQLQRPGHSQAQSQPSSGHPQAQFQPSAHPRAQFQPLAHSQAQFQPSTHPQAQFQPIVHSPAEAQFQPAHSFYTGADVHPQAHVQEDQVQPQAQAQAHFGTNNYYHYY